MGYTHYWNAPAKVTEENLIKAFAAIKLIVKKHRNVLAFEDDQPDKPPMVDLKKGIRFNGIGGCGYETFMVWLGDTGFRFCKTDRQPYDQAVCECLLVLRACIPEFRIRSDGFSMSLKSQEEKIRFDGTWDKAIDEVKGYGFFYRGWISNRREPYCDLGMVLVISGQDGERWFDHEGYEVEKPGGQKMKINFSDSTGEFHRGDVVKGMKRGRVIRKIESSTELVLYGRILSFIIIAWHWICRHTRNIFR